jgi:hypothetical protein
MNDVQPTERYGPNWNRKISETTDPNVYGLYARETPLRRCLSEDVRHIIYRNQVQVGNGTMPYGLDGCRIKNTRDQENERLGDWIFLYAGLSRARMPRITQYFSTKHTFTRQPGGQSLHLSLALLFKQEGVPKRGGKSQTVEDVLREDLSIQLENAFRRVHLAFVQVKTFDHLDIKGPTTCACKRCSEIEILSGLRNGKSTSLVRPLLNARW